MSLPWLYQFHSAVSNLDAVGADKLLEHDWQVSADSEMRNLNPVQNQKARVVANQTKISLANIRRPTDPPITGLRFPCGGSKKQTTKKTFIPSKDQIFHVLSDGPAIAEIVIFLNKVVEGFFVFSAIPGIYNFHRLNIR